MFRSFRSSSIAVMDKVLGFSILSASPPDVAGISGRWTTRPSAPRTSAEDDHAKNKTQQRDNNNKEEEEREQGSRSRAREERRRFLRFAPELDGIDCFETIVSH